jgi:aldose 1-epimerase
VDKDVTLAISAFGYGLRLVPALGGSIAQLTYRGQPLLRGSAAPQGPLDCGCFPLVPYCNRVRHGRFIFRGRTVAIAPNMSGDPSPLHGDGWLAPWQILSQSETGAELFFSHEPGEWPWRYESRQSFSLSESGLAAEITCRNLSDEPMPCGLGFHPYFPCDADTVITTRVETVWTVDDIVLPVEQIPATGRYALDGQPACARDLDNGYGGWGGEMTLSGPGGRTTRMASPDARFFQIYSPPSGGLLAAEPVSHANAALNEPEARWADLGLRILAPGEEMRLRMELGMIHSTGSV